MSLIIPSLKVISMLMSEHKPMIIDVGYVGFFYFLTNHLILVLSLNTDQGR